MPPHNPLSDARVIPFPCGAGLQQDFRPGSELHRVVPIRPTTAERRLRDDRPDCFELLHRYARRPTLGERLVTFFRGCASGIGWSLYALVVAVACYFAFQVGRGAF